MSNTFITLRGNENQALAIGRYAIAFMRGTSCHPADAVLQKVEQFHRDSIACGVSALACGTNAPCRLREEALEYPDPAGVPLLGSTVLVKPEKAVVANSSAVREWDSNGTNFGYNPTRGAVAGEFGHNDFYPVAVAAAQRAGLDGAATLRAMLLVDDGKVRLRVNEKGADYLVCEVIAGRKISNNKGVNVPGVILPIPALTEKDRRDLPAALDMGVDWIAQSFVQKPEDVAEARKLIGGRAALMAKIEKPSALEYLQEIVDLADGIMLARGDLGVETPAEDVPSTQKHVVHLVRETGKPLIVATQMLESMIESPTPTRAEASDVATAVYDGTDAVMLSAETASGAFPIEAVDIMNRICTRVEQDEYYFDLVHADHPEATDNAHDAITSAATHVARDIHAACIVTYTQSGTTTLRMARHRPWVRILSLTPDQKVARRLALSYAVKPVVITDVNGFREAVETAVATAKATGLAKPGERLVMTAGVPFGTAGSTNILRVAWVE